MLRMTTSIDSLASFFAHAVAIEREAAARYDELAGAMNECGNRGLAALFRRLAEDERAHGVRAAARAAALGVAVPESGPFHWLGFESPEATAHAMVHWRMLPVHGLRIALSNERRAVAFFESVADRSSALEVQLLARESAVEETEHVNLVMEALARETGPAADAAHHLGSTAFAGKSARLQ
jgi:rubrerythrin